ncbi:MAG TPA: MFS transporter [Burkholderiales bacterium]|nr:MFS transporter [Burkholderiales bacterium]
MHTGFAPERRRRTILKVSWRLLPLIVVSYLVAYIDRTNVAFAALTMNKELGISAYLYGWGAGIFFLGYALFEVPSNVILERVGARRWIARIMLTWGIISGLMAATTGPISFLVLRFLLGVAEAGFFPGIILYLTYWYPAEYRGRVISTMYLALPVSNAIASAVSGAVLGMDGILGVKGWQWVFIVEAIPAIALALVVLKQMTDRPAAAKWLGAEEREWLESELEAERRKVEGAGRLTLWQSLTDKRVLTLSLIYFFTVTANYGITFFMPQIVKGLGLSNTMTGLVASVPYIVGAIGLVLWGYSSDRRKERRWHLVVATTVSAFGLIGAGWLGASWWAVLAMCVATVGIYGSRPCFWPMPSFFLTGAAAAAGIALINSIGNLGGYVGPFVVGWIKDSTRSFEMGLYFLAGCALLSGMITYFAVRATNEAEARQAGEAKGVRGEVKSAA